MSNVENGFKRREMFFEFEEGVKLYVDRVPGTNGADCGLQATTVDAAVKGICLLICKLAEEVNCSEAEVLCRLATQILREEENPDTADSQAHGRAYG